MGKRLVIAEKPMLAKAILDAIPGTARRKLSRERLYNLCKVFTIRV